ncbi:MAG TPA: hypothetical protein VHZ03_54475 [Trebonia sp.]|nr:hypothetical protein [Trebonia sp.]
MALVCRIVVHFQRDELATAERQVHPSRPDSLDAGEQVGVETDLGDGAGLGGPGELCVDYLVVPVGRARFTVRCGKQVGPHEKNRAGFRE